MEQALCVRKVGGRQELLDFARFPFELYRGDRCWVPYFLEERCDFLDEQANGFFRHAQRELFVARKCGKVVGTIAVVIDENYNRLHRQNMASFGFFESVEDQEVASQLFDGAERWARERGMHVMRGPLNFSINHEIGLQIDGFDHPPMVMTTYNPRYYQRLVEEAGYKKLIELYAYICDVGRAVEKAPAKMLHAARVAMDRANIRIRHATKRRIHEDMAIVQSVYNKVFDGSWGFVPETKDDEHLARTLQMVLDPELILIAETSTGIPVGVSITAPDCNQALRLSGGNRMYPFGIFKFRWQARRIDQARTLIMGVTEEYRGHGIPGGLLLETSRVIHQRGFKRVECSWLAESNTKILRFVERLGATRYKTHRIYEKALTANSVSPPALQ